MAEFLPFSINIGGELVQYAQPAVMAIVNATPDSFYADSRASSDAALERRIADAIAQGADILDIGGCSTRPGAEPPAVEVETERVARAIAIARRLAPAMPLSVDTFRPEVAEYCARSFGPLIVNDISGGCSAMYGLVAKLHLPYILTANDRGAAPLPAGTDIAAATLQSLASKVAELRQLGVADVVIDPGFGFHSSPDDDYRLLATLEALTALDAPVLVGLSRKSMLCKLLGIEPDEALPATSALHVVALLHGASILRVHDVTEARQAITLIQKIKSLALCL